MNILNVMLFLSVGFFTLAILPAFLRLLWGPGLADRVVAFEVLTFVGIGAIAFYAAHSGQDIYFIVLLVWTIVSFLGTVSFARYIEKRGKV